MLRRHGKH